LTLLDPSLKKWERPCAIRLRPVTRDTGWLVGVSSCLCDAFQMTDSYLFRSPRFRSMTCPRIPAPVVCTVYADKRGSLKPRSHEIVRLHDFCGKSSDARAICFFRYDLPLRSHIYDRLRHAGRTTRCTTGGAII